MHPLIQRLGTQLLLFDGAMGTLLQARGLAGGQLPELWNIQHPELIVDIHRQYVDAGCDLIKANTFGANALKLSETSYTVEQVVSAGMTLARQAAGSHAAVALDIGPTGRLLQPYGDLPFEDAYEAFARMIRAGRDLADIILIETMSDTYEAKAALLAARENSSLPVIVTFTFDQDGRLLTGGDMDAALTLAESLGAAAVGMNCGLGPHQMLDLAPRLMACTRLPVCINPNAGLPVTAGGITSYPVGPEEFANAMASLARQGAALLGGCCGTTPAHIRLLSQRFSGQPVVRALPPRRTVVSSATYTVTFGLRPLLIGERINPTGKPKLKQALRDGDYDYLCREAIAQTEHGADLLDVNVGLPGIDEAAAMEQAILRLQGITNTPLQIDTADPAALERALRLYNGKPLVNSVNGKVSSMEQVLPLVRKYGAAVVALTLDESGIPDSWQGRLEIARRILQAAEVLGIPREDILVDPLTMTVSTGGQNAVVTLDALEAIHQQLGVHTVLGVSNISFGLPRREILSSAFFTLALQRGLSAGIVNPLSDEMQKAYRCYCALTGLDTGCQAYISAYADAPAAGAAPRPELTLHEAIVRGLKEDAVRLTHAALETAAPMELINQVLIPALDEVGRGFEKKTLFLPQLLLSADAAREAFGEIRQRLSSQGGDQAKKGKILLATVYGDIHDIGKNIVKVLLENYGFDVVDLGKNVPPEEIVQRASEEQIRLVGLSALMTTTVTSMEETIRLLRQKHPCQIMVGGAVLNEEYAREIGADFYSPDAMGSVRYAEQVFAQEADV